MNLWTNLRNIFRSEPPPAPPSALRNKPGGLAWIKDRGELDGTYGRIVTTVCLSKPGHWLIEPPQSAIALKFMQTAEGRPVLPGDRVLVTAVTDAYLEPIKNPGDEERSQEADFQPKVPAFEPRKVKA